MDSVLCLHHYSVLGPVSGKVPDGVKAASRSVAACLYLRCTVCSQTWSNRTKLLSSTTAALFCSQPLFLSSQTLSSSFSMFPKPLRRDRYLLIDSTKCLFLLLFPNHLLFSSHPLCSFSLLIAEPAVAPAAAAALQIYTSHAHMHACVLTH